MQRYTWECLLLEGTFFCRVEGKPRGKPPLFVWGGESPPTHPPTHPIDVRVGGTSAPGRQADVAKGYREAAAPAVDEPKLRAQQLAPRLVAGVEDQHAVGAA